MKVITLASGSGGNATFIITEQAKILVDCGISYRQIQTRLKNNELDLENLDGILITHEHSDHIKGIDVTLKRHDATCYLTKDTYEGMYFKYKQNVQQDQLDFITPYKSFKIKDVTVTPISVSHDASDAVGYIIEHNDKKLVYITDIGYLPKRDHDIIRNANMYIFESNYDVTMLFTSRRPFYLKQRIDSVKGHMSNNDSAYNLAQLVGVDTKQIVLAHRSKECNTNEQALETYQEVFYDYGLNIEDYNIIVAHQDIPTTLFEL